MDKIRIGKDITLTGVITVNGVAIDLEGLVLEAVATLKSEPDTEYPLDLAVSGSQFTATFRGIDQTELGKYVVTLWQNRNDIYQTAWDVIAFQLVEYSFKENDDLDGLDLGHVDLGVIDFTNKRLAELMDANAQITEGVANANEALTAANNAAAIISTLNTTLGENETLRQGRFEEAIANAQEATAAANSAASSAATVISTVNTAVRRAENAVESVNNALAEFPSNPVEDAPTNGKSYVRKNNAWEEYIFIDAYTKTEIDGITGQIKADVIGLSTSYNEMLPNVNKSYSGVTASGATLTFTKNDYRQGTRTVTLDVYTKSEANERFVANENEIEILKDAIRNLTTRIEALEN